MLAAQVVQLGMPLESEQPVARGLDCQSRMIASCTVVEMSPNTWLSSHRNCCNKKCMHLILNTAIASGAKALTVFYPLLSSTTDPQPTTVAMLFLTEVLQIAADSQVGVLCGAASAVCVWVLGATCQRACVHLRIG